MFRECWKFNLLTKRWSKVFNAETENMPEELVSNAVKFLGETLLVYGGTGYQFGEKRSNKCSLLYPYASPKSIESVETTGDGPDPQYGQAIAVLGSHLYVIGGTTGYEYTCDIYRLDLVTRRWECVYISNERFNDEDPEGRYRHEIASDDKYIYLFGGGTRERTFDLVSIPAFDYHLNKWIFIPTKPDSSNGYPEPRKFHSCIQQETKNGIEVVIVGGYKAESVYFDDVWKLNLTTHQWTCFAQTKLPYKLYFHDASSSRNGCMYIFGGTTHSGTRTNDLHKMWTKIPKLSEISWEAIMHYCPKLTSIQSEKLIEIGVPLEFVNRATRSQKVQCDF